MNGAQKRDYGIDTELLREAAEKLRRCARRRDEEPSPEFPDPVERALAWIEAGLYGRCSVCTTPLSAARMRADPAKMVCHRCKDAIASSQRATEEARRAAAAEQARCPSLVSLADGPQALHSVFVAAASRAAS